MVKINNNVWTEKKLFTNGSRQALSDVVSNHVVLFFYPRANTPGCTNESKDFSAAYEQFKAHHCDVIGVSADSLKKQQNFKAKYDMPFELIADVDEVLCHAFEVIIEKNMYGKKFMGIERSTFVLDAQGEILKQWRKVKVPGHVAEVLTAVKDLSV